MNATTYLYTGINPRYQWFPWLPDGLNVMYSAAGAWNEQERRFKPRKYLPGTHGRWFRSWRKPGARMLLEFVEDYGVSADRTIMIGDSHTDLQAAVAAGCAFADADIFFGRDDGLAHLIETKV